MPGKSVARRSVEQEQAQAIASILPPAQARKSGALINMIEGLALAGRSEVDIAALLGIDESTLSRWKVETPAVKHALLRGRELAESHITRSLVAAAAGYSHRETKLLVVDGKVEKHAITKHYPPNVNAAALYLTNRHPER